MLAYDTTDLLTCGRNQNIRHYFESVDNWLPVIDFWLLKDTSSGIVYFIYSQDLSI